MNDELIAEISIHALLAESDSGRVNNAYTYPISPRSPCGERRGNQQLSGRPTTDFYPRSPCGERLLCRILFRR